MIIGETPTGPGTESTPACRGGCNVSYETFAQVLRTRAFRSVDAIAATTGGAKSLTRNGEAILVNGGVVSPNVFDLLGVKPVIGRAFTAEDDQLGVPLTTVLSHQLWETQFGKDPGVIGTDVKLSDSHYIVIGVMPPGFRFEINSDFWLPVVPTLDPSTRPSIRTITVFARLAPGRTIADLRAELANVEPAVAAGAGRAQKTKLVADPLRERYASSTQSHDLILRRDRRVSAGARLREPREPGFDPNAQPPARIRHPVGVRCRGWSSRPRPPRAERRGRRRGGRAWHRHSRGRR